MIKLSTILSEIKLIDKYHPLLNNKNLLRFLQKNIREFTLSEINRNGSKVVSELLHNGELNILGQYPQLKGIDIDSILDINESIRNEVIQKMVEYMVKKGLGMDGGDENGKEAVTWNSGIGLSYSVENKVGEEDGSYEWRPIRFKGYNFAKLSYDI